MSAADESDFADQLSVMFTGQPPAEPEPEETEAERAQRLVRGNVAAREGSTTVTHSKNSREARRFVQDLFGTDPN